MRKEYDLTKMKKRPNPFAKRLKSEVTLQLGIDVIEYFTDMAEEIGIPYQNLIDLYLRDCVASQRKLFVEWDVEPTHTQADEASVLKKSVDGASPTLSI